MGAVDVGAGDEHRGREVARKAVSGGLRSTWPARPPNFAIRSVPSCCWGHRGVHEHGHRMSAAGGRSRARHFQPPSHQPPPPPHTTHHTSYNQPVAYFCSVCLRVRGGCYARPQPNRKDPKKKQKKNDPQHTHLQQPDHTRISIASDGGSSIALSLPCDGTRHWCSVAPAFTAPGGPRGIQDGG